MGGEGKLDQGYTGHREKDIPVIKIGFEAVFFVVLLNTVILLIGLITTGTGGHIAVCLLGIGISVAIVVIIIFDALRVRIKLNDIDAALSPPAPDL